MALSFKNNNERKLWLNDYKSWGIWYVDEHIGATYYRYCFDNGAQLIVDEYTTPATKWHESFKQGFFHLVGGPEPREHSGVTRWNHHEIYERFPDSETEIVEFLKETKGGAE